MNKRNIKYIVVHCSESSETQTIKGLIAYWKKRFGNDIPGYHWAITRDGNEHKLQDESKIAYGAKGYNGLAIHVGWIGGLNKSGKRANNITKRQEAALFDKVIELSEKYPTAEIVGHCDLPGVAKSCPLFDVKEWLSDYTPDFNMAA